MMKNKVFAALFAVFLCLTLNVSAQESFPFYNDIQRFKASDSAAFPASGQILFIGSSSFTMWQDVNDYFPGYHILNRGFGGSRLLDLIRYRYEIIFPYAPRQIVMYCGENDFVAPDDPPVSEVVNRFETLYRFIRGKYPTTPFLYISMKPSPSRQRFLGQYREANSRIQAFLQKQPHAQYADTFSAMLNKDGSIMTDIFISDNLHLNKKGYTLWQKILKPALLKQK